MTRLRTGQSGTTLLELLFSLFIFAMLISVMALFPAASQKTVKSTDDQRAALVAQSICDSIRTAMNSGFHLRGTQQTDSEILIKIVHDGLSGIDPLNGQDKQGELTIQLPTGAEKITGLREENEITNPTVITRGYILLYKPDTNKFVRYPQDEAKVFPLAQRLLDKNSPFYNPYDELSQYSFDIEVAQAAKVRRPRNSANGKEFTGSAIRVYELVDNMYEFNVRIYRNWRPRTVEEKQKNAESSSLVRVYKFQIQLTIR